VGRGGVFRDYRLRVAEVVRDYGMNERTEAPADSTEVHSDVILWRAQDDGGS